MKKTNNINLFNQNEQYILLEIILRIKKKANLKNKVI